jgi:S1-C subfamily serine protease
MKKKILGLTLLLFMFMGGMVVADTINGTFEGNPIVKIFSGGKELVATDVPAFIYHSRTMVPLSLLRQTGAEVIWDPNTYSINIKLADKVKIVHPMLTQEQLNKITESVFAIYGSTDDPTKSIQGTGFIIANGVLITNYDVAGDSTIVQFNIDGKSYKTTEALFKNKVTNVMGIKVDSQKALPYSTILPQKDDIVYSIGYSYDKLTITEGTVLYITEVNGVKKIVSTAKTDQGGSGGILLNDEGQAIGVTTSNIDGSEITQSTPMLYIQEELARLK